MFSIPGIANHLVMVSVAVVRTWSSCTSWSTNPIFKASAGLYSSPNCRAISVVRCPTVFTIVSLNLQEQFYSDKTKQKWVWNVNKTVFKLRSCIGFRGFGTKLYKPRFKKMNRSETGMSSLFLSPQHEQRRYSAGEPCKKKLTANLSHSLSLNETNACKLCFYLAAGTINYYCN